MANDDNALERLIAALREVDKGLLFVPEERDAAILEGAKANLVSRRKRMIVPWLAAAAAVMMGAVVILGPRPKAREDVNRDGRVDVRDALLLARKVSVGQPLQAEWDLNGDGRVDQNDAAAIARRVVRLTKGGS